MSAIKNRQDKSKTPARTSAAQLLTNNDVTPGRSAEAKQDGVVLTVETLMDVFDNNLLPKIRNEIKEIRNGLKSEIERLDSVMQNLDRRFYKIEESQQLLSDKYDQFLQALQSNKKRINDLEASIEGQQEIIRLRKEHEDEINKLREDQNNAEVRMDDYEQYGRRDCLEIHGIPVVPLDNPAQLVQEVAALIEVELSPLEISISHRLPPIRNVRDRLIVKIVRRDKRDEIVKNRAKLRGKTAKDLPSEAAQPNSTTVPHEALIHINESLTTYRRRLFGKVREFKKTKSWKHVWTQNGRIMLRETDNSSVQSFTTFEQFEEFKEMLAQC